MIAPLTPNTQAILLLTAPLIVGRSEGAAELLSLGEYNRLARLLRDKKKQPGDLIGQNAPETVTLAATLFGRERMESLLGRGFLLSQAVDRWNTRAIWIVSRADGAYPRKIKHRLKEDAPPVFYGCGEISLLEKGGLAVVGSRHVDDELVSYTESVGRMSATAQRMIISGGAKGIDQAAMRGALDSGGTVAGVMADSLERAALARDNREALMDGRLVLMSPYDPAAGFNVGHAMQRNKIIYALADAALVVTSDFQKGGTWTGAIEQLERLRYVPLFVRNGANAGKGNAALQHHGAIPWPNPQNRQELDAALISAAEAVAAEPTQNNFPLTLREPEAAYEAESVATPEVSSQKTNPIELVTPAMSVSPSDELLRLVRALLTRELDAGLSEEEVSVLLNITKPQAKAWLTLLVADGHFEKIKGSKPPHYRSLKESDRLL